MTRNTQFLKFFDRSAPVRAIAMGTDQTHGGGGAHQTLLWWIDPQLRLNVMVIAHDEMPPEFTLGDIPGIEVQGSTATDCSVRRTGARGEFTPRA